MINSITEQLVWIADQAEEALLKEVNLTPKPGLVDRLNNGSHSDMDLHTFLYSISALSPYFQEYIEAGYRHQGTAKELFYKVRSIGIHAEKAMLEATQNVNTHKGANFSFAILLASTGRQMQKGNFLPFSKQDTQEVLLYTKEMNAGLVTEDFMNLSKKEKLSYGEKLFLKYGISGIRGEAEKGYPTLKNLVLPHLRKDSSLSNEELYLETLLLLMSEVEDANLINRGGMGAWLQVKEETKKILDDFRIKGNIKELLFEYDDILISRNLSPGGSADLLALAMFFAALERIR